jgi:hypothetical protein
VRTDQRLDHGTRPFRRDSTIAQHADAAAWCEVLSAGPIDDEFRQTPLARVGGTTGVQVDDQGVTRAQRQSDGSEGAQ